MFRSLRAVFFILLAYLPSLAFADGILSPPASDVSVSQFLNPIFGSLVPGGGGGDALASVIGKFNAGVLLVGGILLAYGIIAGTMQTAHDGEVLGRRWSSMWMPIRTSIGVAAIVPMGSGYSVIQFLVMWLVVQGVGLADSMWSAYTANTQSYTAMAMNISPQKAASLGNTIFQQELCKIMMVSAKADEEASLINSPDAGSLDAALIGGADPSAYNVCGSVNMPKEKTSVSSGAKGWFNSTFSAVNLDKTLYDAHKAAATTLQTSLGTLAREVYSASIDKPGVFTKKYDAAISAYISTINNAAESAVNQASSSPGFTEMVANASKDGWAVAGAWYMKFIRIQNLITASINQFPEASDPSIPKLYNDTWKGLAKKAEVVSANSFFNSELGITSQANSDLAADKESSTGFSIWHFITSMVDVSKGAQWLLESNDGGANPVMTIVNFGNYAFNAGVTIITIMIILVVGVKFAAGIVEKTPVGTAVSPWIKLLANVNFTDFILAMLPLVMTVSATLLAWGGMLAFYIPMIPFIIWMGVVIGWLVLVVEAVIAAPLWAVMHIHPDADGIAGRGGQGYNLIMSLTLRPALAILGLCAAMTLVFPVGKFVINVFWSAWAVAMNNETGLFVGLAGLVIFTIMIKSIIKQMFDLAHIIPDQLLRWIGGDTGGLGNYSRDLVQGHEAQVMAASAFLGNRAGDQMRQTVGNATQRVRDKGRRNEEEEKNNELLAQRKAKEDLNASIEQGLSDRNQREETISSYGKAGLSEGGGVAAGNAAATRAKVDNAATLNNSLSEPSGALSQAKFIGENGKEQAVNLQSWSKLNPTEKGTTLDNVSRLNTGGQIVPGKSFDQPGAVKGGLTQEQFIDNARDTAYSEWAKGQPNADNLAPTYTSAVNKFNNVSGNQVGSREQIKIQTDRDGKADGDPTLR